MTSPHFFSTSAQFRAWLDKHHASASEVLVGYYRKDSGKPSMTWSESVDEALCYGWIDGIRRSHDETSYTIRFTPRKPRSIWSNVNIGKVKTLMAEGRMRPAGLAAWERRDPERSGVYAFERERAELDAASRHAFEKTRKAWSFFQAQPPGYRRLAIHWVTSAKKPETRAKRLASLIAHSGREERLPQY